MNETWKTRLLERVVAGLIVGAIYFIAGRLL